MARFRPKPLKTTERLVVMDSPDEYSEDEEDSFTLISNRRQSKADKHATRRTTRSLSHSDTSMFPEEESEKHLQQVIQKQDTEIPTPSFRLVDNYDHDEQEFRRPWKCPRKYIECTATVPEEMIAKVAEYDLDEEDEFFLSKLNFPQQILSKDQFEFMMDRFEAECIQDEELPPLEEMERVFGNASPKMLQMVYDHWVARRKISSGPLVAKLRPPTDPHRKHKPWRRNDASSYKKMWQLRQEMEHARTLIEMIRKRENLKRDLLVTRADIIMSNLPNFETDHEVSSPEIGEKKIDDILLLEEFDCVTRNSIHERLKGR